MSYFSIWPMLAIVGAFTALLCIKRVFRFLDDAANVSTHRLETLDGLRGFLATSVVFHHMALRRWNIETHGTGGLPHSHFYVMLGQAGVSVFFMITGFLFWTRLLEKETDIDWVKFYINRLFRIAPLYFLVFISYVAITLHREDYQIRIPISEFTKQLAQWSALGFIESPPFLLGNVTTAKIVGQTWTLHYEWLFYSSLPFLAMFARGKNSLIICISAMALTLNADSLVPGISRYIIEQFLCGMIAASLLRSIPSLNGDGPIRSCISLSAAACAFKFSDTAYSTSGVIFLGVFFAFITSGTSIFGLLQLRGATRLGHVSFSIYLLHGLVLTITLSPNTFGPWVAASPNNFWIASAFSFSAIVFISIISFLLVERSGIQIGKRVTNSRIWKRRYI